MRGFNASSVDHNQETVNIATGLDPTETDFSTGPILKRAFASGLLIEDTFAAKDQPPPTFELELTRLINKHSLENQSNTPDFILAEYLVASLEAFNYSVKDFDSERADETHANTMEEVFSSTCDQRAAWNAL